MTLLTKEKRKLRYADYRRRNRDKINAKDKIRKKGMYAKLFNKDPIHLKYRTTKNSAKIRGISWELTEDSAKELLALDCSYCGISNCYGIDRIDSDGPYSNDNTTTCCTTCNLMKRTLSLDKFKAQIVKIYEHLKLDEPK